MRQWRQETYKQRVIKSLAGEALIAVTDACNGRLLKAVRITQVLKLERRIRAEDDVPRSFEGIRFDLGISPNDLPILSDEIPTAELTYHEWRDQRSY